MNNVKELQALIRIFAEKKYQQAYLWKYVENEIIRSIYAGCYNYGKNIEILNVPSDEIPHASRERAERTKDYLNSLEQKDVMFGTIGIRRSFQGKLEHTVLDAYVRAINPEQFIVIEAEREGQEDEKVATPNRKVYDVLALVEYYGQDEVDREDMIDFFIKNFICPLQETFQVEIPHEVITYCIFKLSFILKIRKAYLAFFDEVLERVNPKIICYTHGRAEEMCFLHEAAEKRGIPTAEIFHGAVIDWIVHPKSLAYADYYLTHSDLLTVPMRENGIWNTVTVGKPEVYENAKWDTEREGETVISFISSLEPEMLEKSIRLAQKLRGSEYLVVYKAHSAEFFSVEEANRIETENPNWICMAGATDIRDLYFISDVVVGMRSTGIVDALAYSRIKVFVLQDKEKKLLTGDYSFLDKLAEYGDITVIEDEEDLYEKILICQHGTKYREKGNHYWPTDAKERFQKFLQTFLNGERPQI